MNYKQTLDYLYASLPMFHRIGAAAYKANLDNTHALCKALNHPENAFKSVHIAGTNGKGSTSHMLASVLQAAGYKTGLYTSPHLKDFRERIRINGKMISQKHVCSFVDEHQPTFEKIQPSFFEWTVALAFDYFRQQKVEVAIIETGLGGRLDSTNVINPLLSIITNIGLDHTHLLGNTLALIAKEKAGIIKKYKTVIIGETHPETEAIFDLKARTMLAPIFYADAELQTSLAKSNSLKTSFRNIDIKTRDKQITFPFNSSNTIKNLQLDLLGNYQLKNVTTVLMSLALLYRHFPFTEAQLRTGLSTVQQSTGLMGRWQILSHKPLVIADTAHNEDGIRMVMQQVKKTPHKNLHIVLGMVNDKAIDKVLNLLPKKASYYFCKANIPRALDADELAKQATQFKLKGVVYSSVKRAFGMAVKQAKTDDLVLICGSNFTVAEVV